MTRIANLTNEPIANIAVDKSRVKEYSNSECSRVVYLNDGTEFQIELFNPYKYEIGISVSFDEETESPGLLILKPGQRFWLDRFIDSAKRFRFSTYSVENSTEAKEATADNGFVTIKLYREIVERSRCFTTINTTKRGWWDTPAGDIRFRTLSCSCNDSIKSSINAADYNITEFSSSFCNANSADITNTIEQNVLNAFCDNSMIETGRVEEGSNSDQVFTQVDKRFESYPFRTEKIKILPSSRKPVSTSDIAKRYCYNCGRKVKDKFKFCPFCGAEQ